MQLSLYTRKNLGLNPGKAGIYIVVAEGPVSLILLLLRHYQVKKITFFININDESSVYLCN